MSISSIAIISILFSSITYLIFSIKIKRKTAHLEDHLPISNRDSQARVATSSEFSSATVATTISLATVILAFTDLASYMGLWLLWTVFTTALGIFLVRLVAPVIWRRLAASGEYRSTLHDFLGNSFDSKTLKVGAAICTSLGFIGAFALELTVGGRLLTDLVPWMPHWIAIACISLLGLSYTMLGGFRAVILTDTIQMKAIWLALFALAILAIWKYSDLSNTTEAIQTVPVPMYDFSYREGLIAFLIGIFVINVPTYLSDMSVWQRIAASQNEDIVKEGLMKSVLSAVFSWSFLALLSCVIVVLVPQVVGTNPLLGFLSSFESAESFPKSLLLLIVITGLFAATLSTASTQLIASGHTIHTDIIRQGIDRRLLIGSTSELVLARVILLITAVISVLIVEGLQQAGFAISDLVFAIFGAQLGLFPIVCAALVFDSSRLRGLGKWATTAVILGFIVGWCTAGYGKWIGDGNLVFLSPVASLVTSFICIFIGFSITSYAAHAKSS